MKKLTLIACVDRNGLLGIGNEIPWISKEDMAHFRKTTMGHSVLMGRKTWESLPAPLTRRTNIIITTDVEKLGSKLEEYYDDCEARGETPAEIAASSSLKSFFSADLSDFGDEMFIIGGASIYEQTIFSASHLIITKLLLEVPVPEKDKESAVYFPLISEEDWEVIKVEELVDSIGKKTGDIFYFESKTKYENVFSIDTKTNISREELFSHWN